MQTIDPALVTALVAMCVGALMVQAGVAKTSARLAAAADRKREQKAAASVTAALAPRASSRTRRSSGTPKSERRASRTG